jgi:hypothetical protein
VGFIRIDLSEVHQLADDGLRFEAGPTADYGEYVELGTSRMAAEPYAGPAFDQELPGIVDAIADAGSRIL